MVVFDSLFCWCLLTLSHPFPFSAVLFFYKLFINIFSFHILFLSYIYFFYFSRQALHIYKTRNVSY